MEFCRYYSLVKPLFAQRDLRSVSSINEHTRVYTCTAKTKKIFFYFLATLCSTWKCLASTWGWNVASKRCCSFTGKDIADCVKDNTSTVARRPYLATSQASRVLGFDSGAFSAGKAIKLPRSCCKELSLATSCLRSSTENDFRTRFLLVIIKRTFLELAWKRSEHLIVSEAPNNKTANCFH